eukprot:GEMP01027886.1.p1 GENE.GEMP01027886.1~~GEMP01027886.1.p1  ORF type:complete len:570 (+),score=185.49 GEMP01027886.1:182-1891(+)
MDLLINYTGGVRATPIEQSKVPRTTTAVKEEDMPALERARLHELAMKEMGSVSLGKLLVNVFGAADEDDECVLSHTEVQNLLEATLIVPRIGLQKSDIRILLASAVENEDGSIAYRAFIENAPVAVDALRKRRKAFENRPDQFKPPVSWEEVMLLYVGEEIEESANAWQKQLHHLVGSAESIAGSVFKLPRRVIRESLHWSRRFTEWEVMLLMQMIPQQDECIDADPTDAERSSPPSPTNEPPPTRSTYAKRESFHLSKDDRDILSNLLLQFRIEVHENPVVEIDVSALRCHFVLKLKEGLGGEWAEEISIWHVKRVLVSLDQIALSLFHVHALLSMLTPNEHGFVDTRHVLRLACTYIPIFFDARCITRSALDSAREKADAQTAKELRELKEFQSHATATRADPRADEDCNAEDVAEETEDVEKLLVKMFQVTDRSESCTADRARGKIEIKKFCELCHEHLETIAHFAPHETRAFIAHAELDANAEVVFTEHTKENVSFIFEFRKCHYLNELALAEPLPLLELQDLDDIVGEREFDKKKTAAVGAKKAARTRMKSVVHQWKTKARLAS